MDRWGQRGKTGQSEGQYFDVLRDLVRAQVVRMATVPERNRAFSEGVFLMDVAALVHEIVREAVDSAHQEYRRALYAPLPHLYPASVVPWMGALLIYPDTDRHLVTRYQVRGTYKNPESGKIFFLTHHIDDHTAMFCESLPDLFAPPSIVLQEVAAPHDVALMAITVCHEMALMIERTTGCHAYLIGQQLSVCLIDQDGQISAPQAKLTIPPVPGRG